MQVPGSKHPGMVHRTRCWAQEMSRGSTTQEKRDAGVLGAVRLARSWMAAFVLGCPLHAPVVDGGSPI
jgi:hypothetical protein